MAKAASDDPPLGHVMDEPGVRPPRFAPAFIGNQAAEASLAQALAGGRLHHAWLITGPKGVGKTTLAFRFAKAALSGSWGVGPDDGAPPGLGVPPDDTAATAVEALSHPDLRFVTRTFDEKKKRMRSAIDVDAIREVTRALRLAPAWGGRRLVIIDPAEDMNRASQNALLKTLEEPPDGAVLLLISHAPGRLAPTVRSRCRRLDLRPLPEEEVSAFLLAEGHARNEAEASQLAVISKGSPGRAIALAAAGGAEIEGKLVRFLASAVRGDWSAADLKLADEFARPASETAFRVFFELMFDRLAATARAAATGDATGNAAPEPFSGPLGAPHRWAEAWARTREIFDDALAVNLDRKLAILSAGAEVGAAARAG